MKKSIIFLLLASLSGCFNHPSKKTGLEGKTLPSFKLLLADSATILNTSSISEGKPIVMFYFIPTCPYCKAEMEDIIDEAGKFNSIHFYVFTSAAFSALKGFYNHYNLKKYPNITIGQDYDFYFGNYFKVSIVPYVALYDSHKRLKQVFVGKTDIKQIKDIALD